MTHSFPTRRFSDLCEFAQSRPLGYKGRDGKGKWLLRQLLYRHVPRELVERPKKGFSVPVAAWLRGPLKDWGAALLDPVRLRREGVFHAAPITRKWEEHQQGRHDWSTHRSEEHTSELQSLMRISYAVFCFQNKNTNKISDQIHINAQT